MATLMPKHSEQPAHRALVVGLGMTGLSCARYLSAQGYTVTIADSRALPPMAAALHRTHPGLAVHSGGLPATLVAGMQLIVVSPGVAAEEPLLCAARAAGVEIVGDVELFARVARAPVIAITGSNGKSTVTAMIGALINAAGRTARVSGNIGIPVLDLLAEAVPDVYVLELSSFQLETTDSLQAAVAAVLNISPDHMARYPDLDAYAAAKARVLNGAATVIVNRDDPVVAGMQCTAGRCVSFGSDAPHDAGDYGLVRAAGEWLARGRTPLLRVAELPLLGTHNTLNVMAALAAAEAFGVAPDDRVLDTVRNFQGLTHRTELVDEWDGIRWINDSKGTNVGATRAAIAGFANFLILIAGGRGKGADFAPLREALRGHGRAAILFGEDAELIDAALTGTVATHRAADLHDAVAQAARLARPGDVVLFSPACASFDMFDNFEQRGRAFCDAVHAHRHPR